MITWFTSSCYFLLIFDRSRRFIPLILIILVFFFICVNIGLTISLEISLSIPMDSNVFWSFYINLAFFFFFDSATRAFV